MFKNRFQEDFFKCQLRHQLSESDTFSAVPAWNTSGLVRQRGYDQTGLPVLFLFLKAILGGGAYKMKDVMRLMLSDTVGEDKEE